MAYSCEANIRPDTLKCTTAHCTSFQGTFDEIAYCKCKDYLGRDIKGCAPKDNAVPVPTQTCYNKANGEQRNISEDACQDLRDKDRNWSWRTCYCCCSCFAWYTKIRTPVEARFVQLIEVNDSVLAASIDVSGANVNVTWEPVNVSFSDGTSPGAPQQMVLIQYGADGEITATPDQLFLLPDGKLKAASRLTPLDQLVGENGNPVDIESIRLIQYTGGIHHIGLGEIPPEPIVPINGHLMSSEGLITGDFWLQTTYASTDTDDAVLVSGHKDLPMIGSYEYSQQSAYSATLFSATRSRVALKAIRNPFCEVLEEIKDVKVPKSARRYLTVEQADELNNTPDLFYPLSVEANVPDYRWTKEVFACMYSDVNLYLEWTDETPNLYAFEQFGQKTVYISGRLLRAKGVYREGVAMMLAFGVAMFYADQEEGAIKKLCTGLADYFGAGYVMRQAFNFNWPEMSSDGYRQIRELFSHIEKHRGGDPNNLCLLPSLDCRLECISNALSGKGLPACSGVPMPGRLRLKSAEASIVDGEQSVVAVFNEAVDANSSQEITNYTIMPETVITTAVRDARDTSKVVLTVTLPAPPEGDYKLSVRDIISNDGSTLNPNARTANFKIPPD